MHYGAVNKMAKLMNYKFPSLKLAENLTQLVGNTVSFTQIFKDYENDECNNSCDNNLSIACSD